MPTWSREAQAVLAGDEPQIPVGQRCLTPRPCPFMSHCWPKVEYPLTSLPNLGKKLYVASGYRDLREVPEQERRGPDALRVWRATREDRAEMSATLRDELRALA